MCCNQELSIMHQPLIVIPAWNEALSIGKVLDSLHQLGYHQIVVVDDCSDDDTVKIAKKKNVTVITLPYNMGAWKAVQAGIRYAHDLGYKKVVTMDADGQHNPKDICKLLIEFDKGNDLVVGACTERGSRSRHLAWGIFRLLSRLNISDLTSGFRVYGKVAIKVLSSRKATMLDYQDIGVLFLIKHFGLRYSEIPVIMSMREDGVSRIFYSWGAVFRYMVYTLILTSAKALPFLSRKYKYEIVKDSKID